MFLGRRVSGVRVGAINQIDESYCDDINLMVNKLGEFKIVDEAFTKFEDMSGAFLSRNHKSKVLGLGSWVGKSDWPLSWIKTVKEVKVFGVKIVSSYKEIIIIINWDFRFGKFEDAVRSWSSRALDSLSQRIEVLKTFALSRLWYLGSALPIKKGMVKKIEKVCGKFIWNQSGRILRIKMEELKKPRLEGGLGMPCVSAMTDALLVRQMMRMLGSGDSKTIGHLVHWVGAKLDGMFQAPAAVGNVLIPDHFAMMIDLLNEAVVAEVMEVATWRNITNKNIYSFYISLLPEVRIVTESGLDYKPVWRRLGMAVMFWILLSAILCYSSYITSFLLQKDWGGLELLAVKFARCALGVRWRIYFTSFVSVKGWRVLGLG